MPFLILLIALLSLGIPTNPPAASVTPTQAEAEYPHPWGHHKYKARHRRLSAVRRKQKRIDRNRCQDCYRNDREPAYERLGRKK